MYSKVYTVTCDPGHSDALMEHYDSVVTPAVQQSTHHVGHHMIETGSGEWILVSNYMSGEAAEAAAPLVRELVGPMVERFGVQLNVIGEGDTSRQF